MDSIDITPTAVTAAASKRLLTEFVRDLSAEGLDHLDLKSHRLRARKRLLSYAEQSKAKDRLGLIASASLMADLIDQGWRINIDQNDRIFARRPSGDDEEVRAHKRRRYHAARDAQLRQPATRAFIARMERGALTSTGRHSIFSLMRDGRHLQSKIDEATNSPGGISLTDIVQPYIQFVRTSSKCAITGFMLQDIWRYFRHTWSTPYESVPGRSMMFLVRDAAAASHPVMGIGALSSAAVQLDARDRFIGWLGEELIADCQSTTDPQYADWVLKTLDKSLKGIYRQDFLEKGILPARLPKHVPQPIIVTLQKLAEKARHEHYARAGAALNKPAGNADAVTAADWQSYARSPLFTFKRAREIAALLDTRNIILAAFDGVTKTDRLSALLSTGPGKAAFSKVVRLARSMTVGTEIADLTVCGAVPPYNALLGGKLVAMLATSPEIVLEYKRRYQSLPSIIASSMAGRAVVRPANLVFVGTTSLYGERPNQYDRTGYPANVAGGPELDSIRYRYLTSGERKRTSGVGTFQFGHETKASVERYMSSVSNGRRVNNVFGEGTSPKLRSLRDGLNALGIDANELLKHGLEKVIYGVSLISNAKRYLLRLDDQPQYLFQFDQPNHRTEAIARYWFERWASARLGRVGEVLSTHTLVRPIQHGARVTLPDDESDQFNFRID